VGYPRAFSYDSPVNRQYADRLFRFDQYCRTPKLDHDQDRCDIEFDDGRRMALRFRLFTANELRHGFESEFAIEDLCGLDIFHGRFSSDQRWNPAACGSDPRFWNVLTQLEARFAHNPTVMEHATHLMLVGRRRAVR
jgi:hypothetical protein